MADLLSLATVRGTQQQRAPRSVAPTRRTGAPLSLASVRPAARPTGATARLERKLAALSGSGAPTGYTPRPRRVAPKERPRSLWQQASNLVTGIPQGLAGFGKDVVTDAVLPVRVAFDLIKDQQLYSDAGEEHTGLLGLEGYLHHYAPASTNVGASIVDTAGRVTHPSEYLKAVEEGRILDVAVEDIGNAAMVAGGVGKALGTTASVTEGLTARQAAAMSGRRGARAGGAAVVEDLAEGAGRAPVPPTPLRNVRELVRLAPSEAKFTVSRPGTGIAGMLERGGATGAARGLARTGQAVRTAASLGETVGNAPILPYQAASRALGRGLQAAGVPSLGSVAQRVLSRTSAGENLAFPHTDEGRTMAEVNAGVNRAAVDAQRQAMSAEDMRVKLGLSEPQGRAVGLALDRPDLLSSMRGRDFTDAEIQSHLDQARPTNAADAEWYTPEDVRTLWSYLDENSDLDPEVRRKMGLVAERMRGISDVRTQAQLDEGMNPAQLEPEVLPYRVEERRRGITTKLNRALREWSTEWERTQKAERISAAFDEVGKELPPPPDARAEFEAGERRGRARAGESIARRTHAAKVRELNKAIDHYIRLVEDGPSEALSRAEERLVRLTDDAERLRQLVERADRRVEAGTVLSRVGDEPEVGGAPRQAVRVPDPNNPGRTIPAVVEGVASAGGERLAPAVTPVKGEAQAIRRRAEDEVIPRLADDAYRDVEGLSGSERPSLPDKSVGGEYNWWYSLDKKTQNRMQNEGWMTGRTKTKRIRTTDPKTGKEVWRKVTTDERPPVITPDQVTEVINNRLGTNMDVDEAMGRYVDAVRRYWEAKDGKSGVVVDTVADLMGLTREQVAAALRGKIADYGPLLTDRITRTFDELRTDYRALPADEQTTFNYLADQLLADPDATPGDFQDLLEGTFNALDIGSVMTVLEGATDIGSVVDWMRSSSELPATLRARIEARTPAQTRQLGRLEGQAQAARAQAQANVVEQRAARRDLTAIERAATIEEQRAAREMERASTAEEANRPYEGEGPKLSEISASADRTWKRTTGTTSTGETTNPLSPGERFRVQQGVAAKAAAEARVRLTRAERSVGKYTEDLRLNHADRLPDGTVGELGRTLQDRLDEDVNRPAIVQMRNAVRSGGDVLGGIQGKDDGVTLTGLTRRIAGKYGMFDDVLTVLDDLRNDMREAQLAEEGFEPDVDIALVGSRGSVPMPTLDPRTIDTVIRDVAAQKGIVFDQVDNQALIDSVEAESILTDMAEVLHFEGEEGRRLGAPYRVADVFHQSEWNMPEETRNKFRAAFDRFQKRRSNVLRRTYNDYTKVMPAKYRTMAMDNQRHIAAYLDKAEELNAKSPGSGDVYLDMAEETMNTIEAFVNADINPTHLTGGREAARTSAIGATRGEGLGQAKTRGQRVRSHGLRQLNLDAYARVEASEALTMVKNRRNTVIGERLGRRADAIPEVREAIEAWESEHPGLKMSTTDIARHAKDAGWVAMESTTGVAPDSIMVPRAVKDALSDADYNLPGLKLLRRGNQMWKTSVLPFSTKWMVGNVIGNVVQAAVHGGVGPIQLARTMNQIRKSMGEGGLLELWRNTGESGLAPAELIDYGLTANEHKILRGSDDRQPGTKVGRAVRRASDASYKLNSFVDNMTREAVYFSKLKDGIPSEAALQSTVRSLGDFTRMSNFERKVVREILPFYAWLRHSITATLRLPITSPTRAAFLLNLSQLYSDPDMSDDLLSMLGSKVPVGGSFLDIGSVSPLADVGAAGFPLDPMELAGQVTPFAKFGDAFLRGQDFAQGEKLSRPAGTARTGIYGEEKPTSILSRFFTDPRHALGELGYVATQQVAPAPVRALRDLALGGGVRYDTGYEVPNAEKPLYANPPPGGPTLATILRGLNLPSLTTPVEPRRRR